MGLLEIDIVAVHIFIDQLELHGVSTLVVKHHGAPFARNAKAHIEVMRPTGPNIVLEWKVAIDIPRKISPHIPPNIVKTANKRQIEIARDRHRNVGLVDNLGTLPDVDGHIETGDM